MKVTESRSGARCTLTAGESVALLRLKEQQKGIKATLSPAVSVEELKLDRTQPETILQEAMQAVGDFLRKQKMQLLLGCRSAQSWFARYPQQDLLAQKVKTKPGF